MGHEMHRLSTRMAFRFVSLYTPFLPRHTCYAIVNVLERLLPREGLKKHKRSGPRASGDPISDSSFDSSRGTFRYSSITLNGQKCPAARSPRPKIQARRVPPGGATIYVQMLQVDNIVLKHNKAWRQARRQTRAGDYYGLQG